MAPRLARCARGAGGLRGWVTRRNSGPSKAEPGAEDVTVETAASMACGEGLAGLEGRSQERGLESRVLGEDGSERQRAAASEAVQSGENAQKMLQLERARAVLALRRSPLVSKAASVASAAEEALSKAGAAVADAAADAIKPSYKGVERLMDRVEDAQKVSHSHPDPDI